MNDICADEVMHLFQFSARAVIGLQLKQVPAAVFHYYLTKIASYVTMLKLLTERSESIAFREKIPFDRPDTYAGAVIDIFH